MTDGTEIEQPFEDAAALVAHVDAALHQSLLPGWRARRFSEDRLVWGLAGYLERIFSDCEPNTMGLT